MEKAGGWKLAKMEPCMLPEDVASGFCSVMENMVGASYVPVLYCAAQLVNGMNHMLICKQTLSTAGAEENLAKVILHHEIGAKPDEGWRVLSIEGII